MRSSSMQYLAFLSTLMIVAAGPPSTGEIFADDVTLDLTSSATPGDVAKVDVVLEVAGVLKFKNKDEIKSLPTVVSAKFGYEEKRLDLQDGRLASARIYRTAEAQVEVNQKQATSKLSPEHSLVVARSGDPQVELLCPAGRLTADELELIQIPANSLLIEGLLPSETVKVGGSWKHADDVVCGLLNLDAASQTDVQSTLAEVLEDAARIELKGTVQGAIGGVSTEMELTGRYKFDRRSQRITWLALLLKEKRSIGHVEPGVEMQARVQMLLAPCGEPKELTDLDTTELAKFLQFPDALRIGYVSPGGRFGFEHERRWHVMTDRDGLVSLRLVDRGELVAQCNVTAVTPADATRRPNLAQFQADIRRSLDKHFGQFVRAGESDNSNGHTVFRVEAIGEVEGVEITWIYYLVQNGDGRHVVLAFTCEQSLAERMEKADEAIIATLQFFDVPTTASQPTLAPGLR